MEGKVLVSASLLEFGEHDAVMQSKDCCPRVEERRRSLENLATKQQSDVFFDD